MEEEYPVRQMLIDILSALAINFFTVFFLLPSLGITGKTQRLIMTLIFAVWMFIRLFKMIRNYRQSNNKLRRGIELFTALSLGFYAVVLSLTLI